MVKNETKTENQYLEEYNNLPLGVIIEMENYAGWCPTGSHTEIDDKTDKELIKLFRIYTVKVWKGEDYQEVKQKLLDKVPNDPWRHIKDDIIAKRVKLWRDERKVENDNGYDGWKWRLRNVEPFYKQIKREKGEKVQQSNEKETELSKLREFYYDKHKSSMDKHKETIYPELPWKKIDPKESLPFRLYNIEKNKVEEVETEKKVHDSYAILSYVWGDSSKKENQLSGDQKEEINNTTKELKELKYENGDKGLTLLGYKSWQKAIEVCKHESLKNFLDIKYLWMDQLCIDQSGKKDKDGKSDKEKEVPKMKKYYGNADVTLVSMPFELLKKLSEKLPAEALQSEQLIFDWPKIIEIITESEWFTRTWTYQEGWLSKQVIFMFEDCLIDGRFVAAVWAFNRPDKTIHEKYENLKEFYEGSKKIATPIGWAYHKDGYYCKDTVNLRLDQVLREVKNRFRSIPVDGIYATLGLLPYGELVNPKYKGNLCKGCKGLEKEQKKEITCNHPEAERTEWPTYTKEDVEKALLDVMKVAMKTGHGEPLAWFGPGNETPGKCWMPKIRFNEYLAGKKWDDLSLEEKKELQKNGSTYVEGGIEVKYIVSRDRKLEKEVSNVIMKNDGNNGITINGSKYEITLCENNIMDNIENVIDERSIVEGGLHRRDIKVRINSEWHIGETSVTIWGTRETLEKVEAGNQLVVPNKNWKSRDSEKFAILVKGNHRIDLVILGEGGKELEGVQGAGVTIGLDTSQVYQQLEQQYQSQIQIPPK